MKNIVDFQVGGIGESHNTENRKKRATTPLMTMYEKARVLGIRATQLSDDAPPLVDIGNMSDCNEIAFKELVERKIPFIIRRYFSDGTYEDWSLDELLIPEVDF